MSGRDRPGPLRSLDSLRARPTVVWGAGMEGAAAVRFWNAHLDPASLHVVVDAAAAAGVPDDIDGIPVLVHGDHLEVVAGAEVIVKSPGVSPYKGSFPVATTGKAVTGGTRVWFDVTGGEGTIAVTGSKGKSTTSALIAHLLGAWDQPVLYAGNVGRALLDVLHADLTALAPPPADRWVVLELSSFQSAEVARSPQVGVLTALFPEHLDWHGTVERYYEDKINLLRHRAAIATVANVANTDVAARAHQLPGLIPYGTTAAIHARASTVYDGGHALFSLERGRLVGHHNATNLAGALTALRAIGVDVRADADRLAARYATFSPLPHRLEQVGTVAGRLVVDDSLSTAPQAAVAALAAFEDKPVALIVGGHDRGLDYAPLAAALAARTTPTWVLCVPASGERLAAEFRAALGSGAVTVRVESFADFDDAVARADTVAPLGGVILLSPGAPSFGRFRNYAERGLHFRALLGLTPEAAAP